MTTPAQPATGDPAPATGEPSQQPTPATDPAAGQQPATGNDWATVFDGLTPDEVKAKLDHARTWEKRAKDNKRDLDDLRAKTKPQEGEPTADDYRQQLADRDNRITELEDFKAETAYRDTVRRISTDIGADADALLDSASFRDEIAKELGEDFDDADLRAAVTKVGKKFAKKPRFASQVAASRSGGEFPGSPTAPTSLDAKIAEAENNGNHAEAIRLKRMRAAQAPTT